VLTEAGTDTQALMRVVYFSTVGRAHDELVAGMRRLERARFQGDKLPIVDCMVDITRETTLVVEALGHDSPARRHRGLSGGTCTAFVAHNARVQTNARPART
jgi:hypothetical protein